MGDAEGEGPSGTFPSLMAEGALLSRRGEPGKALLSFTNALQLQAGNKHCLVARSMCYLKLGDTENSLRDAEASLQNDKTFSKGLYQKAETLYTMGDFEFALVYYHRGHRLRPELQKFRLGIQKAQEAIDNSVGSPSSVKLENKGDLCFLSRQAESKKVKQKLQVKAPKKDQKQQSKVGPIRNEKTERQLLGELYADKAYLEKLLKDADLIKSSTKYGMTVEDLILGGINYLDTRTEFWQQQKPIYARVRDRKLMQQRWLPERKRKPSEVARYILKSMEEIDMLLTSSCPEASCKKAEHVLKTIQSWSEDEIPNKNELIGNLYSCIGNAQIEMGQMGAALQSHKMDLEIAREKWEEKIPLAKTSLEKTWLFHEIGRCYLELDEAAEAQDYGEKSLQSAEEEGDVEWQLNASVLVAQAQVKLQDFQSAVMNFEKALEKAKLIHNDAAQQAIIIALDDANKDFIEELRAEQRRERLESFRDYDYDDDYKEEEEAENQKEREENKQKETEKEENERNGRGEEAEGKEETEGEKGEDYAEPHQDLPE
ncbi:tetratricopeptide repeat protein 25 isoform X2 [Gopherus evgoodei]|uniref:tetratricopeptide repeat protein 25 isoform X2 n=1 Tax=Gopherus evgoodei TaxID=1825980 RepID=UPI0011CFD073|nr:tetratricopeptide repeat protein 25 isoform X2 [Gopherus evgoodei]